MKRLVLLVLLVAPVLVGCADRQETYCEAVKEHQKELTEIAASSEQGALFGALDLYRDLQDKAPSDISDEWQQVVSSLEALDEALEAAGVDAATYNPKKPPEGLSDEDRNRIAAAASEVGSSETTQAMAGVQQQALDVCKTALSL